MRSGFILSCESTIDLPYSYCEQRDIPVLFYSYQVDGVSYEDDMGRDPEALPQFYGFLDAGKTKFIQETLEDERFNAGERTLLLVFEEGEEEYDFSTYPHKNVYLETLDQQTVTTKELQTLAKKYRAERVVAELNGMQQVGDLYMRFPENWAVAQEVMFADGTSILAYNAIMRSLVVDKLTGCEMVVFNRLAPGTDIMPLH